MCIYIYACEREKSDRQTERDRESKLITTFNSKLNRRNRIIKINV